MTNPTPTHQELLQKIRAINPVIAAAIDDVDVTLLDEFKLLTISEKIDWASQTSQTLESLSRNNRKQ